MNQKTQVQQTMQNILSQREEFIVIGLTGRMGSGCSKVAEILSKPYDQLNFPYPCPQTGQTNVTEEARTGRILAEYANVHWLKFDVIRVGALIATFILNDDSRFVYDLSKEKVREAEKKKHQKQLETEQQEIRETERRKFQEALLKEFYDQAITMGIQLDLLKGEKEDYTKLPEHAKGKGELYVRSGNDYCKMLCAEDYKTGKKEKIEELCQRIDGLLRELKISTSFMTSEKVQNAAESAGSPASQGGYILVRALEGDSLWEDIKKPMAELFRIASEGKLGEKRRNYLELVDELVELYSYICITNMMQKVLEAGDKAAEALWEILSRINKCVEPNAGDIDGVIQIEKFVFAKYITGWFGKTVREHVKGVLGDDGYARLFQRYGQIVRYYGCIPPIGAQEENIGDKAYGKKKDIFAIPRKINQHIKVLRHPFDQKSHRPVRIVVDSIKNVFEAVYLRYRYSAFYLWAITTDKDIRDKRLYKKNLNEIQIRKLDWNEYPDKGSEVIASINNVFKNLRNKNIDVEKLSAEEIQKAVEDQLKEGKARLEFYWDWIAPKPLENNEVNEVADEFNRTRRDFFQNGSYVFYAQDIDGCICNADVYLFNNVRDDTDAENSVKLLQTIVRNVSLVMYPGLVRPTPVERCMQIALTAKANSGCLSRQVGAVVTDSQYNILAIGWNDVPCGEVPCAYKNLHDIQIYADGEAYSEYELHDDDFRTRIKAVKFYRDRLQGLPLAYCFKDEHKNEKDPMRSRAMHAEEKALALCGREAEGGFLFTTSSPCEMCSKNAKNHKIKKIFYIEAYPGISQAQYTNSGDPNNRAELILFSGAVGRAYIQMYTPLLPHKDVLKYLHVREEKPSEEEEDPDNGSEDC